MRNVFHTRKLFGFDLGASVSYWKSTGTKDDFYTISAFPLLRFTPLRTKPADFYLFYSVAGPTYFSKEMLDGLDTGTHFTFQDVIGLGFFAGRKRRLNVDISINHYSNGNIFPDNPGIKIPLTLGLGFTF